MEIGYIIAAVVVIFVYIIGIGISIASYILSSLAIHTIGKRRQIKYPWLAWIPIANNWALGSIAREYDGQKGIKRKWNVVLLAMSIAVIAAVVIMIIAIICFAVSVGFMTIQTGGELTEADLITSMIGLLIIVYSLMIVMIVIDIVYIACAYICYFKLFESTVPEKALKYFIISILVPLGMPICLMKCRNKGYPEPEVIWGNTYTR